VNHGGGTPTVGAETAGTPPSAPDGSCATTGRPLGAGDIRTCYDGRSACSWVELHAGTDLVGIPGKISTLRPGDVFGFGNARGGNVL
jgi:hypothetical protein